jgi:apolipoprotein N-acyltransferase
MEKKKRNRLIILSVLSGLLLGLPWLEWFSGIILLVAFIPLFFVESYLYKHKDENRPIVMFGFAFLAFLVWNIVAVSWISKVTILGGLFVIITNSLLLALLFFLFHATKRNLGMGFGNFSLFVYWLGWEYFMMNAELAFPWLNLGNGFAKDIALIQWYEFTGVLGGSLWVLVVNLTLYAILKHYITYKTFKGQTTRFLFALIVLIGPIIVSSNILDDYKKQSETINVGLIQPNIDPYNEKYEQLSQKEQIDRVLKLAGNVADSTTDYLIAPETTIHDSLWQQNMNEHPSVRRIRSFTEKYPGLHFILGVDIRKKLNRIRNIPPEAEELNDSGEFYMRYNGAIQINSTQHIPVYYKSKLVSGIEKVPYPGVFNFLNDWLVNVGDETSSLGTQKNREVFSSIDNKTRVAPVICYESVFGEFVTRYIHQGADVITIITNDGWFENTQGYKQHLHFARLRAIETRRSVARAANTGISCFINQKGQIEKSTKWWKQTAIKGKLHKNQEMTFYVKFGNYIGRISAFLGIFALLYLIAKVLMLRSKNADLMKLRG